MTNTSNAGSARRRAKKRKREHWVLEYLERLEYPLLVVPGTDEAYTQERAFLDRFHGRSFVEVRAPR